MIHIIRKQATPKQMREMLQTLGSYIKLAVDVEIGILAGGGELHVDCEQTLLSLDSQQPDVWGADWYPFQQRVGYESIINIRPSANNRSFTRNKRCRRCCYHQRIWSESIFSNCFKRSS